MQYEPSPMETSGTDLPPDLIDLAERLAEDSHEI